jgi:fluoride exporter
VRFDAVTFDPVTFDAITFDAMDKHLDVVGVVAAGGVLGSLGRYSVGLVVPVRPGGFPFATFGINLTGCLLMGVLAVLATEVSSGHRLLRPFLGAGVLGGYTTFSAYAVDSVRLLTGRHVVVGVLYITGTLVGALAAVAIGIALTRATTGVARRRAQGDELTAATVSDDVQLRDEVDGIRSTGRD